MTNQEQECISKVLDKGTIYFNGKKRYVHNCIIEQGTDAIYFTTSDDPVFLINAYYVYLKDYEQTWWLKRNRTKS